MRYLTRCIRQVLVCCVVALIWPLPVGANNDFIVILDQSLSMLEKQPNVPSAGYHKGAPALAQKSREALEAIDYIITDLLREEDYFALVIFGDNAEVVLSQSIGYKHEHTIIRRQIHKLLFEDKKTDIIAGIQSAGELLTSLNTPKRRKIMILITDGLNDPPANSLYLRPEQQQQALQSLRDTIRFNKWNVNLFGLGPQTGITELSQKLDLPPEGVFTVDDFRSGRIAERLKDRIRVTHEAEVKVDKTLLKVKLEPRLFGGYTHSDTRLTLTSTFDKQVTVSLRTAAPVVIEGVPGSAGQCDATDVTSASQTRRAAHGISLVRWAPPGRWAPRW